MDQIRAIRLSKSKRSADQVTPSMTIGQVSNDGADVVPEEKKRKSQPKQAQSQANLVEVPDEKASFLKKAHFFLVTLQDIQLDPGGVKVFIDNVHILVSGEIAFEFDVFAYVHRWKLIRMDYQIEEFHTQVVAAQKQPSQQSDPPSEPAKIPYFLKTWLKTKDGGKFYTLCKSTPQGSLSLQTQPEKCGPLEELKKIGQAYFDLVLKSFPTIVTIPAIKSFLDPAHDPSTWFLARNSKLRGTLEVNSVPDRLFFPPILFPELKL